MDFRIFPPDGILETAVTLPSSKSMAVRSIVLAYLSGDRIPGHAADTSTDAAVTAKALCRPFPADGSTIDVAACGAALRFICAIAAATPGADIVIDGTEGLHRRPIAPLVEALRTLSADVEYLARDGFAPVRVKGKRLDGGDVAVDASQSSQYVSALMFAAPLMRKGLKITLGPDVQSAPYIRLTAHMMSYHGIEIDLDRTVVEIRPGNYRPATDAIEADWSAAMFWYEIAALTAGWVTLNGLKGDSLQADCLAVPLFERLGALTEFTDRGVELSATPDLYNNLEADVSDIPDAVPALAVTAALAGIPFRLTGVAALRLKESDRLEALADELKKIGVMTETENYGNTFVWDGRRVPVKELPVFETYNDHRIAMALIPAAVFIPGMVVKGIDCIEKSYPAFIDDLRTVGFEFLDPEQDIENQ